MTNFTRRLASFVKVFTSVGETPVPGSNAHVETDVLVVGAGPGGSAAAYHLARHGVDGTVVEKASFPREKVCGDGMTPRAIGSLERMQQPVGMIVLEVALDTFWTKPAFVVRELFPRFETDDLVVFDQQLDAALHPAETAMRLDDLVRLVAPGVALARRVIQMRPELGDKSL